jgi:hypothetical protein
MSAQALVLALIARGVALAIDGDGLRVDAPPGILTDADRASIRAHKAEIIAQLRNRELWHVAARRPKAIHAGATYASGRLVAASEPTAAITAASHPYPLEPLEIEIAGHSDGLRAAPELAERRAA